MTESATNGAVRCTWAGTDPLYVAYHDTEWGRPVASDQRLYEKLCLEGFQSGLSWLTILRKRENFRAAFADFAIDSVAAFGEADVARLLADAGIVRHRGKIEAAINNARRAHAVQDEFGSLAAYIWSFEPTPEERPADYTWDTLRTMTTTASAQRLSKDLRNRGWAFVGPTTCYAFMQSMGLVNDHVEGCCCREAVEAERAVFARPASPSQ